MVEPEMAYADLDDVMDLAEDLVGDVVARVLDKRRTELQAARARHVEARARDGALPAHQLRRGRRRG